MMYSTDHVYFTFSTNSQAAIPEKKKKFTGPDQIHEFISI